MNRMFGVKVTQLLLLLLAYCVSCALLYFCQSKPPGLYRLMIYHDNREYILSLWVVSKRSLVSA